METTIKTYERLTGNSVSPKIIVSLSQNKNGVYIINELTKVYGEDELYRKVGATYSTADRKNALATFNRRVKNIRPTKKELIQFVQSEIEQARDNETYTNDDAQNWIFEELQRFYDITREDELYMLKATNTEILNYALNILNQ
jgi:hypothetical protein